MMILVIIMSKKELMTSYEHIQCGVNSNNNPVSFIQKWTNCNDNIKRKDSMQIYPNPDKCPDNVFNLWRPFAMEVLTSPYSKHTEGLDIMLNHILVLCDNDKPVYDYFIGWIAMMIQKPEVKTTCITLISKVGAGKGTCNYSPKCSASRKSLKPRPPPEMYGGSSTVLWLMPSL
jgi:hypothetical protein